MALKLPTLSAVQKGSLGVDAFTEKWTILSSALDQIASLKQSNCSFQVLHQSSYQLVLHNHSDALYKKLEEKINARIAAQRDIIRSAVLTATPVKLLITLVEQWAIHEVTTKRTCDIFPHLERQYCANAKKTLIAPLSTRAFATVVLTPPDIFDAVTKAYYDMIDRDRKGEEAPQTMLLRAVCNIFIALDRVQWFEGRLEARFLQLTKQHYAFEASQMIATESGPSYIAHYTRRLQEETRRTAVCVDPSTVPKVDQIVAECFIAKHGAEIIAKETSGVDALLRAARLAELRSMYQAFAHVHDVGQVIFAATKYFNEEGMNIVCNQEYIDAPVTFIEKLIELRGFITTLLSEVMVRPDRAGLIDRYAETELLRVFETVVNRQPFCAEYLSRLLDAKLRTQISDAEIDRIADSVMTVFKALNDKDLFESAYRGHLARRLLVGGRGAAAEEQERIFIQKLKKECGASVTSSLEGMFADRATSDDLMDRFREKLEERNESLPIPIQAFVLTAGFWPPPLELKMQLPPELERTAKVFRMFYLGRHHGRKFEYSLSNGSVDVRMTFGSKKYDVNVPTMCVAVLMLFQGDESRTVEELATQTGSSIADASRAVASLARATPTNTGILSTDSTGVNSATKVTFNAAFKSKQLKIKVAMAQSAKDKATGSGGLAPNRAREQIDEDRKYKIDAAVVRIMKSRKVLDHNTLIAEVIGVTKTFCPAPEMIKKRIEHLIEREFLERSDEDRNYYKYLA